MKNFSVMFSVVLLLTSCLTASMAFTTITQTTTTTASAISDSRSQSSFTNTRVYAGDDTSDATPDSSSFEIEVSVPPKRSNVVARLKFPSVFSYNSELVVVRYDLPFGLNVEPQNNLAVCTKDGPGGEKVGDVLRYTSQWTMGLPQGDGLVSTVASFSGGIGWQCSMFDVLKSKDWSRVIEALTSNVESRTDEVLLLFERPLE